MESRLFFTIAAYSAMNELHDMTAPILSSTLMNQHPDWVPVINGMRKQRGTDGSLAGRENRA